MSEESQHTCNLKYDEYIPIVYGSARNSFIFKESIGGDLARFIRIGNMYIDVHPDIMDDGILNNNTVVTDEKTGVIKMEGNNLQIPSPNNPVVVTASRYTDSSTVLWLRDSFGNAMSPYMVSTFKKIIMVHYNEITPDQIKSLVKKYDVEYVFVTVVERDAMSKFFTTHQ